jgi:hypothetical protein
MQSGQARVATHPNVGFYATESEKTTRNVTGQSSGKTIHRIRKVC